MCFQVLEDGNAQASSNNSSGSPGSEFVAVLSSFDYESIEHYQIGVRLSYLWFCRCEGSRRRAAVTGREGFMFSQLKSHLFQEADNIITNVHHNQQRDNKLFFSVSSTTTTTP